MTRVLKRPMFRLGGPAYEGITSGLAPRQGYANGLSAELRDKRIRDILSGDTTLGEAQDLSRSLAYQPRGVTPADALIEFGLDIASRPPEGSIFSTAAASAKEPFQRYSKSKAESEAAKYVSEADMFKSLLEAGAEATGESGGKGWLEQWKFQQIPVLNETISRLSEKEVDGTLTPEEKLELQNSRDQKRRLVEISPILENYIKSDKYLVPDEIKRIYEEDLALPEDQRKYTGPKDSKLVTDAIDNLEKKFGYKTGGRVGYLAAGSVMGDAIQSTPAETMPEELGNISYEELRSRLPQEVDDQIVRLLANSAEALEDFATIQTEQDIANFNKKYGVNLVLPAEG